MVKWFIYGVAGCIGLVSLFGGLTGHKILFIKDERSAVITLAIAGFLMCSTGALTPFVTKAPAHPLSMSGYILGVLALAIAAVQIFKWNIPVVSVPRNSLILMSAVIVVKIVIARFGFIFK